MKITIPALLSTLAGGALGLHFRLPDHAYRYIGRVNPSTKEFTWPGTGVSFNFSGSAATINIANVTGANSADLSVDGGAPITILNITGRPITTPAGLKYGEHNVVLRKRSETVLGTFSLKDITINGRPRRDPAQRRKIEIIGDSISVGYGLDGLLPCVNTAAVEDNPKTYGALAADALGADYSVVAWSGKGVTRNYVTTGPDTSPVMPELWTRWGANDADNSYPFPRSAKPQVVVINLGTNDFSYAGNLANGTLYAIRPPLNATYFTNKLVDFVRRVQVKHEDPQIFLMSSPMLNDAYPTTADAQHTTHANAVKAAIEQLGGNKLHFVEWPPQGSVVGCDYHPVASTHAEEAKVLAAAIADVMKW